MFVRSRKCLFIQCSGSTNRYLVAESSASSPKITEVGVFTTEDSRPWADQLHEQLASRGSRCRHVVLLLPRAELEVSSHHLPPAAEDELPELVSHAVSAVFEEASEDHVSDFLVTDQDDTGCEALAFSLQQRRLGEFHANLKSIGLKLHSVTFIGLGAVELLKRWIDYPASTAIAITVGDTDIDFAVTDKGCPILFRSIPCTHEADRVRAQRLGAEIRRTLALAQRCDDEARLYLIGHARDHEQIAQLLSEELHSTASVVNPLDQVELATSVESPAQYANLLGIAAAWNQKGLALDFLNPRRPPQRPGAGRRIACWGAVAVLVLLGVGFPVWQDRIAQQDALREQRNKLQAMTKRANRSNELQDVLAAIQAWRKDDIAWLDELHDLSERLPRGDRALIRRMNMSSDSDGNGLVDLAVQVSRPDVVASLESALRGPRHSVTSKRVSEADRKAKLPWAFETRVQFTPAALPPLASPVEVTANHSESALPYSRQPRMVSAPKDRSLP